MIETLSQIAHDVFRAGLELVALRFYRSKDEEFAF
jgi:hypothetical protein